MCYNCVNGETYGRGASMGDKLTVKQAAKELGYHPGHIRRLIKAETIKAEKLSGLIWLIDREEINRIKREQQNGRLYVA